MYACYLAHDVSAIVQVSWCSCFCMALLILADASLGMGRSGVVVSLRPSFSYPLRIYKSVVGPPNGVRGGFLSHCSALSVKLSLYS